MLTKCSKFSLATEKWLLFKRASVKDSTFYRYKYIVDKYILEYLKNKRLYKLKKIDFNPYIEYLSRELSSATVRNILTIFKSLLKFLEERCNLELKLNLINSPKPKTKEIKVLNKNEIKKLEKYCYTSSKYKSVGILLSLYTGMRLGEICALKWNDIDIEKGVVFVTKTLQRIYVGNGKTVILTNEAKTFSSVRTILIPNKLLEFLKLIRKRQKCKGEAYVLTGEIDKFVEPRTLERYFRIVLNNLKIKNFKFHILRHTYATNCINLGMDPKALSILLGHSDTKITLDRYVHPDIIDQRKFIEQL